MGVCVLMNLGAFAGQMSVIPVDTAVDAIPVDTAVDAIPVDTAIDAEASIQSFGAIVVGTVVSILS